MAEIHRLHDSYLTLWSNSFHDDIDKFNAAWRQPFVRPEDFTGESMAGDYREALEHADRLESKLRIANQMFFDSIEVILAEEQIPGMLRVRLAHDRFSHRHTTFGLRECKIDLVELIERLECDDPGDQSAIVEFVSYFEPAFVAALRTVAETDARAGVFDFEVLDLMRKHPGTPDAATQSKMAELKEKRGKLAISASRRLVQINRSGLRELMSVLSEESAREIQRHYYESSYPEIDPDPLYALPFFESALGLELLEEFQREGVLALQQEYLVLHADQTRKLRDAVFDLQATDFLRDQRTFESERGENEAEVRRLAFLRENLNLAQPARVRAMLRPEQNVLLEPWTFEVNSPIRPWGQLVHLTPEELRATRDAARKRKQDARDSLLQMRKEALEAEEAIQEGDSSNQGDTDGSDSPS